MTKTLLLALFFTKERNPNTGFLEQLYQLEDLWEVNYQENKITKSFTDAQIIANEAIIECVLSPNYIL